MTIKQNIEAVEAIKCESAKKIGRNPDEILLLAVTKLHTATEINEAIDAGITDIGENKVQEIMEKYEHVKPVRWHIIGHLQRNKVKYIIDKVSMIHSVDSLKLAEEIDKRAKQHNLVMDILIQVNTASEESKFGIESHELSSLIDDISNKCPNIRIKGLMCIAPLLDNIEDSRPYFAEAKKLYDKFIDDNRESVDFTYLSMGMTGDYPIAIEEGSNVIRVGTGIFGNRDYRSEEL